MPPFRTGLDPDAFLERFLVGDSSTMRHLKRVLPRIARSRSNVLIQGESGTGKEMIARAIHLLSERSSGPFVAENCAALPDGVIESELFGHVRGAFTGADRDREGLIALADGGTFFLDEVGDLPARLQAKLLRVIQEGECRPVGGRAVRKSDFRVVAATHRDLPAMVRRGDFRVDLYYRLNVIRVEAPPLRERVEDIPLLVEHTLRRLTGVAPSIPADFPIEEISGIRPAHDEPGAVAAARIEGASREGVNTASFIVEGSGDVRAVGVSREAIEMLRRYHWPGNVRELQNVVEAGLALAARGVIGVSELPERIIDHSLAETTDGYPGKSKSREQVMIETALARFAGDKAKAARDIGWSRTKLYRAMVRYGISKSFGRPDW